LLAEDHDFRFEWIDRSRNVGAVDRIVCHSLAATLARSLVSDCNTGGFSRPPSGHAEPASHFSFGPNHFPFPSVPASIPVPVPKRPKAEKPVVELWAVWAGAPVGPWR
jgi:hypothetical protein